MFSSTGIETIVSIADQTIVLVDGGNLIARYRVSTSKFGNGDSAGSYLAEVRPGLAIA